MQGGAAPWGGVLCLLPCLDCSVKSTPPTAARPGACTGREPPSYRREPALAECTQSPAASPAAKQAEEQRGGRERKKRRERKTLTKPPAQGLLWNRPPALVKIPPACQQIRPRKMKVSGGEREEKEMPGGAERRKDSKRPVRPGCWQVQPLPLASGPALISQH